MPVDPMNPATAVTWGPFVQAAFDQFASAPGQVNPAAITNMSAGYTLVRTIQMNDSFGPVQSRAVPGHQPQQRANLRGRALTLASGACQDCNKWVGISGFGGTSDSRARPPGMRALLG